MMRMVEERVKNKEKICQIKENRMKIVMQKHKKKEHFETKGKKSRVE